MSFKSLEFLLFLSTVFLLYWLGVKKKGYQNGVLLLSSYVFYAYFDWRFLFLLLAISSISFLCGIIIIKKPTVKKIFNVLNIVVCVSILGVFKYFDFFSASVKLLLSEIGVHADVPTLNLILPVGISFYIFQAISYTVDIYRKTITPSNNILEYFSYISFFPKLMAGPIERAENMLPQISVSRSFDYALAVDGMRQMLWGFFKKSVIADSVVNLVNILWPQYKMLGGGTLIVTVFMYTVQIYCDFSGYSDIAVGCGKLFGIRMTQNFDMPYFSRNIREFWRKWNISLMRWFRDYVYFPLGGSRCSKKKACLNTLIVFLISGLWHGANWTFVAWGAYHACLFLPLIICNGQKYKELIAHNKMLPSIKEFLQVILTFFLVMMGWVLFRSDSISNAFCYFFHMFSDSIFDINRTVNELRSNSFCLVRIVNFIVVMIIVEWIQRGKEHALQIDNIGFLKLRAVRWFMYIVLILCILYFSGEQSEFIYVNF